MKISILTLSFILTISNLFGIGDIKPTEIKEMIVIGTGRTISASVGSCQERMYNSCKPIVSVSNRDSQWTGSGWITTYQVKYKVVH